ncbi:MAG: ABC transporter ATP-binding protein [Rhodospirillaceae bacterium]|nr:ABC transporter ATP-binding protein [Rhodospirillaceae bacterium]
MMAALLDIANIETWYGPIPALRGVSLSVAKGRIVAVLGANGAGKTTLLRTIAGIVDPRVGTVAFSGTAIHGRDPDKVVRLGISLVPEGRQVFPFLSVAENLAVGAYARRDADGVAQDLAQVYAMFPRLAERQQQTAGMLSGGEQQMLAIGRALMARPTLLMLDEPSLGLSPLLVTEIFGAIRRINEQLGLTVLVVEQNARVALAHAHDGHIMELGRVVLSGTAEALSDNPDVREFYLGIREGGIRGKRRWRRRKTWR